MIEHAKKLEVIERCAAVFGVTPVAICSRCRTATVAMARQAAMVLLLDAGGYSVGEIAAAFYRHPGTVLYAAKVIEHEREHGVPIVRARLDRLFNPRAALIALAS